MDVVVFLIGLVVIGILVFKGQKEKKEVVKIKDYKPSTYELNVIEWSFFLLLKQHRADLGLSDLMPETMCGMLATKRIHEMKYLTKEEFKLQGHKDFFATYKTQLIEHGFIEPHEMLASRWNTVAGMFRNYLESARHRKQIEDKKAKYVGIGVIEYNSSFYSCIIFSE
jgi:hypothetical protein